MSSLKGVSHARLLTRLRELVVRDHVHEVELIAHLAEVDARRLYLEQACPSMFDYCIRVLHFAEGVAYKRIAVARAVREFPELLGAIERGELHLTAASLIAPHLNRECAVVWLAAARHKTAREIKQWIADRKPKDYVKASVRKVVAKGLVLDVPKGVDVTGAVRSGALEVRDSASCEAAPQRAVRAAANYMTKEISASSEPLGANRYSVRVTIDSVAHDELQELRALLRHQIPDGDVAKIVERAIHVLLEQARKQKRGACSARTPATIPSTTSTPTDALSKRPARKIPTAIRRAVWERDGGRCSFGSREGRRCGTRDFLEFHHHVPWARCQQHRESNIHLRCRAHNQHAAELDFGTLHMAGYRKCRSDTAVLIDGQTAAAESNPSKIRQFQPPQPARLASRPWTPPLE